MVKSIIPGDDKDTCFICGRKGVTECHHLCHGCRRAAADRYGLTVHLCHWCHMMLHDTGRYDRELEQLAQESFEKQISHEEWMRIFGKDYTG